MTNQPTASGVSERLKEAISEAETMADVMNGTFPDGSGAKAWKRVSAILKECQTALSAEPAQGGDSGRVPERESAWLVERNVQPPQYIAERCELPSLTSDPWRAVRFATEREAFDFRLRLRTLRDECSVVEHMFINRLSGRVPIKLAELAPDQKEYLDRIHNASSFDPNDPKNQTSIAAAPPQPIPTPDEALWKALKALAEGYFFETKDDRYIIIQNPAFKEDDGSDPNLVIDTAAMSRVAALSRARPEENKSAHSIFDEAAAAEAMARGMAERAGHVWHLCAQTSWRYNAQAALAALKPFLGGKNDASDPCLASTTELPILSGLADGQDPHIALNMRGWLRKAVEAMGGRMTGGGIGCGGADIDIELEGCRYNIFIQPILPPSPDKGGE